MFPFDSKKLYTSRIFLLFLELQLLFLLVFCCTLPNKSRLNKPHLCFLCNTSRIGTAVGPNYFSRGNHDGNYVFRKGGWKSQTLPVL